MYKPMIEARRRVLGVGSLGGFGRKGGGCHGRLESPHLLGVLELEKPLMPRSMATSNHVLRDIGNGYDDFLLHFGDLGPLF